MRFPWVWRRKLERAQREALSLVMRTVRYKGELKAAKAEALRLDHLLAKRTEELAQAREAGVKLEARAVKAEAELADMAAEVKRLVPRVVLLRTVIQQFLTAGQAVIKRWPDATTLPEVGREELGHLGAVTLAAAQAFTAVEALDAKVEAEAKRTGAAAGVEVLAIEERLGGVAAAIAVACGRKDDATPELKVVGGVN